MLAAEYNLDAYGALQKHELLEVYRGKSYKASYLS
jgi:hypothetical protein